MAEISGKKFAGVLLVLIPMLFFITVYLRFDCGGGHCSIGMEWLIMGFFLIVFGVVMLIGENGKSQEIDELNAKIVELEAELENSRANKNNKNAKQKKTM